MIRYDVFKHKFTAAKERFSCKEKFNVHNIHLGLISLSLLATHDIHKIRLFQRFAKILHTIKLFSVIYKRFEFDY